MEIFGMNLDANVSRVFVVGGFILAVILLARLLFRKDLLDWFFDLFSKKSTAAGSSTTAA